MFIKQVNAYEFEWIKLVSTRQFCLEKGCIKTHFADNIKMFLEYQSKMKISEKTWLRMVNIYESQQKIKEPH